MMSEQLQPRNSQVTIIKFVLFGLIIATTVVLYKLFNLDEVSGLQGASQVIGEGRQWAQESGAFGLLLFFCAGLTAILLNIPTAIVIFVASALYGTATAFFLGFFLFNIATTCIYFIGKRLGRDFIILFFGRSIGRLEKHFANRGLITVLHLRLLFYAVPPLNWFLSVMNLSYREFFLGTLIGGIPKTFIYAWLGGVLFTVIAEKGSDISHYYFELSIPFVASIVLSLGLKLVDHYFLSPQRSGNPS